MSHTPPRSTSTLEAVGIALFGGVATLFCACVMGVIMISALFGSGDSLLPPPHGETVGWLFLSACASLGVFDALRSKSLLSRIAFSPSRPMRFILLSAASPLLLSLDRLAILIENRSLFGYANPPQKDQWLFIPAPRDGASPPIRALFLARSVALRIPVWSLMTLLAMVSLACSTALLIPALLELLLVGAAQHLRKNSGPGARPSKRRS